MTGRTAALSALIVLALPAGSSAPPDDARGAVAPGPPGDATRADTLPRPPADHHVHAWSADAVDALLRAQEELGQEVIDPDSARPRDADDVVAMLDSAGVRRGVLLSTAYFFGIPDLDFEDERTRVRAENDYVAAQVRRRPERLVGFCSVNPKAAYALEEIDRCAGIPELIGLKLHLANSDVSLRDSADLARLAEVFGRADRRGMPIVIHLQNRAEDYGARDVRSFLREVLPAAPDVPGQVAHLAGHGGYGPDNAAAVRVFARALEEHPEQTANLFFDMAASPVPLHRARGDSALVEQVRTINRMAAEGIRALGPDRIVYGSDWPAASGRYLEGIRASLPLPDSTLADLLDDPAPYLRAGAPR